MTEVFISYKSLVIIPLIMTNRKINTNEIEEYKHNIDRIFKRNGINVIFDTDKSSINFFEISHMFWIKINKDEYFTEYELIKKEYSNFLLEEVNKDFIDILVSKEALYCFDPIHKLQKIKY